MPRVQGLLGHRAATTCPWQVRVASAVLAAVAAMVLPVAASADHYEAQWSARPIGGVAALQEEGASMRRAVVGGMSLGLGYGISNHLDVGGELMVLATSTATFTDMAIIDGGAPYRGPLTRRADSALLLLGPTWRFGVSWIPVVTLEAGAGARHRSPGTFTESHITLDEKRDGMILDLAASARVGIEHRMNRRLTIGVYAGGVACWSPSAPLLPIASVSLGLSYVHYPRW